MRTFAALLIAVLLLTALCSCGKKIKVTEETKDTSDIHVSGTALPTETVRIASCKKTGALLDRYDRLISTGEYTLKMTVNVTVGGESVPVITTSVYHGGKIKITIEESYDCSTLYYVEDGRLFFFTESGEKKSTDFDKSEFDISLYDGDIELTESGETVLYGRTYDYERYVDAEGAVFDFLFSGGTLERKLLYKKSMNEYTVYTVSLNKNDDGTDF